MADGECCYQDQYLFPVTNQVNCCQRQYKQPMIFRFPRNDMLPAYFKIKS